MIRGSTITLRTVRESDLGQLYDLHADITNRGNYFPVGFQSEPAFRNAFHESGFWDDKEGMLLIIDDSDAIIGHIEYFQTLSYLDELELSYQLYDQAYAGKGVISEAVQLLTRYLFERTKFNRIRLIIHPDNAASRRVAEKCRFVHEGTARGAWYHDGRSQDVEVYARLRGDPAPS